MAFNHVPPPGSSLREREAFYRGGQHEPRAVRAAAAKPTTAGKPISQIMREREQFSERIGGGLVHPVQVSQRGPRGGQYVITSSGQRKYIR
jgi:hypothetical protein